MSSANGLDPVLITKTSIRFLKKLSENGDIEQKKEGVFSLFRIKRYVVGVTCNNVLEKEPYTGV